MRFRWIGLAVACGLLAIVSSVQAQSCEANCGGSPDGNCFCDSICDASGDCCADFDEACPLTSAIGRQVCPVVSPDDCVRLGAVAACADEDDLECVADVLGDCTANPGECLPGAGGLVGFCAENPQVCAENFLGGVESCATNPEECAAGMISVVEDCAANPQGCSLL